VRADHGASQASASIARAPAANAASGAMRRLRFTAGNGIAGPEPPEAIARRSCARSSVAA
jgi:hypothetical protein